MSGLNQSFPRLLTISVPTYNRCVSLKEMLVCLSKSIVSFEEHIEIIVSDNCSTDATPEIISNWMDAQCSDLVVKKVRHPKNVGVSRNLVSLLYAATSDYFMFLGDDDIIDGNNFGKLLNLLDEKRPSAVIQTLWDGKLRSSKVGEIGFGDALSLFYEYGNAWGGVVDRRAAIRAIDSRCLRNEIESIVWPQTVFGYLAMYDSSPVKSIVAVDFEIGRPLTESLNITNKTYWIRSLTDLLTAAALVQRATGAKNIRRRFMHTKSRGFLGHIKAIFWYSLVDDDRSSLEAIRKLLAAEFGWRGMMWAYVLRIDNYPGVLKFFAALVYRFLKIRSGQTLELKIEAARSQRESSIANRANSGKRYGDWF